jgi:hypothetical protein
MSPEVSQNHRAPSQSIAGLKEVDHGVRGQVMSHLTHQDHIDALVSKRRGPGAANCHGQSLLSSQTGRGPIQLQSDGDHAETAAGCPPHGDVRKVTEASTEVEQG